MDCDELTGKLFIGDATIEAEAFALWRQVEGERMDVYFDLETAMAARSEVLPETVMRVVIVRIK